MEGALNDNGLPRNLRVDANDNLKVTSTASTTDPVSVATGAKTDVAATTGTGTFSIVAILKGVLTSLLAGIRVGGSKASDVEAYTRPADSTPYTAGDAFGVKLTVSAATNATPIVLTTGTHALVDGDPITVASVGGNTVANGNYFAKALSTTTIGLYSDKALTTAVIGNGAYTSGGTVAAMMRFRDLARVVGGSGMVTKVQLFINDKLCTARFKLHFFRQNVGAILDNAVFATLDSNKLHRVGEILMPACTTEDTSSDQAKAFVTLSDIILTYICASTDDDLYCLVEIMDAYTPVSGGMLTIRVSVDND